MTFVFSRVLMLTTGFFWGRKWTLEKEWGKLFLFCSVGLTAWDGITIWGLMWTDREENMWFFFFRQDEDMRGTPIVGDWTKSSFLVGNLSLWCNMLMISGWKPFLLSGKAFVFGWGKPLLCDENFPKPLLGWDLLRNHSFERKVIHFGKGTKRSKIHHLDGIYQEKWGFA